MDYVPTGKKPEIKYSIGDFVCFTKDDHNYYGEIKLCFHEDGEPIYGVQLIIPVRNGPRGSIIEWFEIEKTFAVYEKSIF